MSGVCHITWLRDPTRIDLMSPERAGASGVFDYVREQILSGKFKPGEHLNVAEICRAVGTSHIPVREAIRRLEGESLVVTTPNYGAVVAAVSLDELREIYQLRKILELRLVEAAMPKYSEEHLDSLDEIARGLFESGPDPTNRQFYAHHRAFHWGVLLPEPDSWHERMLALLWQVAERYQRLLEEESGASQRQIEHHRHIVAVARRGDVKLMKTTIETHLQMTESILLNRYPHEEIAAAL